MGNKNLVMVHFSLFLLVLGAKKDNIILISQPLYSKGKLFRKSVWLPLLSDTEINTVFDEYLFI